MTIRSVAQIRAVYSHPCRVFFGNGRGYCVGGAICLAHGVERYFPDQTELTRLLQRLNPALDMITACQYAGLIMSYNDRGDFKKAWEAAEEALTMS